MPKEPLRLQSRVKADYRDGGERVCSAMETVDKYAHLISPITGVVGRLTVLKKIPSCFGQIIKSDWIIRGGGEKAWTKQNLRVSPAGISTGKGRTVPQARASAL
jgi:oxazoline/thiazoline synthase